MGSELNKRIRQRFRAPGSDAVEQAVQRVDELNRFLFETVTRWEDEASWVESHLRGLRDQRPNEEELEADSDVISREDLRPRKKPTRRSKSASDARNERTSRSAEVSAAKRRDRRRSESDLRIEEELREPSQGDDSSSLPSDSKSSSTSVPHPSEPRHEMESAELEERVEPIGEFADPAEQIASGDSREEAVERPTRRSPTLSDSAALEKEFALLDEVFGPIEGARSSTVHRFDESRTLRGTTSEAEESASPDSAGLAPWLGEPMPKDRVSMPRSELERAKRPDWKSVRSTAEEEWRGRGF